MKKYARGTVAGFGLVIALCVNAQSAPAPIEAFAKQEQFRSPRVSPDGRYIVFISSVDDQRVALTIDLQNPGKPTAVVSTKPGAHLDLTWCDWANNTRVLCGFTGTNIVQGAQIRGGRIVFRVTQLVAVDADGKDSQVLMNNERFFSSASRDGVLDWTYDDPKTVLVQAIERTTTTGTLLGVAESTPAVFKLDIYSGAVTRLVDAEMHMRTFHTDGNGDVRLASGYYDTKFLYKARLLGEAKWRTLAKVESFTESDELIPIQVVPKTNKAYAIGNSKGRRALWEIDLEDQATPRLIFEHPVVDIDDIDFEPVTGKLVGYQYDTDRPFYQYEDGRLAAVMRGINKALPDTFNRTVSYSHDLNVVVIRAISDINAGTYYAFNVATRKIIELGKAYPALNPKELSSMRSIEYKAQDGTSIPAYLTTPLGARAEKLPLIVMPHGGPIARDTWGFGFLRQFLASRGYAVLQMNFRGSSGYGEDWFYSAHQDWGGLTYSDIADGTRWAVSQGIADPKRVCILGWSFGGYAALVAATRNNDLYQCSVSIAGLSDLSELYALQANYQNKLIARRQLGDNKQKLKDDSPANHAADVAMPVLLIHGTRDAQAPFDQSEKMARNLKIAKKQVTFVELKDADHSLWRPEERATMLREVEAFLRLHLGPGNST
jgi:dipeptidyl aminopeptidase/acylaminoacyl peptidase